MKVYVHRRKISEFNEVSACQARGEFDNDGYVLVATVDVEHDHIKDIINIAIGLTSGDWHHNHEVMWFNERLSLRSTTVNDIVHLPGLGYYLIRAIGTEKLAFPM